MSARMPPDPVSACGVGTPVATDRHVEDKEDGQADEQPDGVPAKAVAALFAERSATTPPPTAAMTGRDR